ncbi:hypothetical protein SAMN04489758_10741 [Thomasclavelia cocleata]|uniref:V-type ATP synthase subunit I n=2 Tax=Thomasclavelia cocleata TaxID=69824 RepID=A0A1I0DQF5_9FIRM|nr:hypothetical protein [Thomasclavelia cocleata]MCR1960049.1 hypothetical protein [Thomasclavelia cocleata]NDO42971.1 hypothetical protein [Thomasclavelia cocleata]SET34802.1 hypothetical protein SAMN04489758_10741 [Thomasclavelia cocleata]
MAIMKTHFFNISFEHKDLMKMLIKMTEYQENMFPQDSRKIANNVKGVSVMDAVNPYNEPLDNIYHILSRLNLESNVQDSEFKEINLHNVNKLIDEINDEVDNIVNIKEGIVKEKEENDEAVILLRNLEESKISVDDVKNTKYITCRFGKIPVNEFTKIQYYRDYEFIFKELNRSKQYVWIVYAGLTNSISQIDNAFSSMSFEQITLPDFAHGKIHEAINELTEESIAMEKYINKMDSKLEGVKNKYQEKLLDTFTSLYNLKKLYDHCRYVVDFSQKASIYTFSSYDLKEIETIFKNIDSVKVMELPVNIYENRNITAPILVKNNSFFKPFENILSVALGDTFDPTIFVAVITMVIGAICVGDIGVGALLIVLGFLFTIKKTNNFGGMLKRIGAAILIGGLFYGTVFYQIELYQPLFNLPLHVIHTFLFGFSVWIIAIIILIIAKKVTRKSIKI